MLEVANPAGYPKAIIGDESWADIALQFKARIPAPSDPRPVEAQRSVIEVVMRNAQAECREGHAHIYFVMAPGAPQRIETLSETGHDHETGCGGGVTAGVTVDVFTPDVWHAFRVEVVGSRVTAFIDGVRVLDSESAALAPRGSVWLGGTPDSTVQYDDVRVVELHPIYDAGSAGKIKS